MNINETMQALAEPFPASAVEWRIQYANETSGLAVPYLDSRAIQNRLDAVFGCYGWQNTFISWHDKAQICGISVYCEERREWITKFDGAANTDIEPVKGGLSDSMKRAAVQWGIGRYLYDMEGVWVDVEKKGKTTCIKKDQTKKLDDAYARAVAQFTQGTPPPPKPTASGKPASTPPDKPKPVNPPIGAEDNVTKFPALYTLRQAKATTNATGVSTALDMIDPQGNSVRAYLRGEHPQLVPGVKLTDLKLTEKTSPQGSYFVVEKFTVAA